MEATPNTLLENTLDKFWETVPPAWRAIRAQIRACAEQHELTVEQFHILRHVNKGMQSISEIAAERRISRPAVSQAVDGLENKGLLTRTTNPGDRRYTDLELTAEGRLLLNAIFEQTRAWMRVRLERLPASELEQLAAGFEILGRTFAESASPPGGA